MIFTGLFLGAAHAQDKINDAYLNCITVNGLNGTISNPREPCSLSQEGCYASGQDYCWRVQSSCKTIRARFNKFIVEEYMSGKDDCPYDKVLLSWSGNFVELCDHSAASKGGQGKIFNPNKDPENLGWLDWTSMDADEFFIELKTDASIDFYGFDLEWECEEFTTTSTTTSTTTTSTTTTTTPTTVAATTTTTSPVTEMDTTLMERKKKQPSGEQGRGFNGYWEGYHLYDIHDFASLFFECTQSALDEIDHCIGDSNRALKVRKNWDYRFKHLIFSLSMQLKDKKRMRKCQESGVAVSTDAARALSKLKHDEYYGYHGSHGHAHDSDEYIQHFHDLENVYELALDNQFAGCSGRAQLATKTRKLSKFHSLVDRIMRGLKHCDHDDDYHHDDHFYYDHKSVAVEQNKKNPY